MSELLGYKEVAALFDESGFSRIPMLESDDSVVGVLYEKDVSKALRASASGASPAREEIR